MDRMFTIPPNTILAICVILICAIVGFLIKGFIKGWDKIYPDVH